MLSTQAIPAVDVHHHQDPEHPPVAELVAHEVHRPQLVQPRRLVQLAPSLP
jgi:hypothetical protein